jgi:hypothetical protein
MSAILNARVIHARRSRVRQLDKHLLIWSEEHREEQQSLPMRAEFKGARAICERCESDRYFGREGQTDPLQVVTAATALMFTIMTLNYLNLLHLSCLWQPLRKNDSACECFIDLKSFDRI